MKRVIIPILIITFCMGLSAESTNINVPVDESLQGQSTLSGSATDLREGQIQYGSPREAKMMVENAINYTQEVDLENALLDFRKKEGRFHFKDLYIFVLDMDGNVLSHGGEEALIGKNMIDLKDSAGKYFIKKFIKLMEESNDGWTEYYWRNYETQKVEMNLTYLKKFNENIFFGCGAYQPRH